MTDSVVSSRLRVQGLAKSYFGVQVLHDVSFEARGGRVLGMVGENGSGKSTTMNVLTGVLPPDAGSILLDGQPFRPRSRRDSDAAGIAFIQQELNIFPNLTVAENLFLLHPPRPFASLPFVSRRQLYSRTRELLLKVELDVSPNAQASRLSPGERQLLEIARALSSNARVVILDEPTSSLTAREVAHLFDTIRRMRKRDVAVLYISHNLDEVLELADDIIVMRDGRVRMAQPRAALTASDLVLAMVGRTIEAMFPERKTTSASAPPVLEVSELTEPGILENINLRVGHGEIVGIAGLMGSGRSELARAVFGLDSYGSGAVRVNEVGLSSGDIHARLAMGVAFLTEDRRHEGLMMDASVADNMGLAALPAFAPSLVQPIERTRLLAAIRQLAERLNLRSTDIQVTPVRALSGGNQQKVMLGRWLLREPHLFILDDPTRGVDISAKREIYRLLVELADAGVAMLLISSELEELIGLCDRIYVMRRGEITADFSRKLFDREAILRAAFGQNNSV